ncbi:MULTISPECIES: signal recognition particle-docking protein FtsY [unclassified Lentimonas]|uniref:signal recognition particle-docking protein FtsY n=1 Tax=unclassified Lentimonas TaxID=2630993 RepID=UPI00132C3185|nr:MULTISPECIES: signal recognition particle-docking protein FtsY [unclassified Lentimonas]CAA6679429.1 Signal recognition particle receptor protein FtsY (=alpha subunit) (TC 3.A.5.1.1) [Lentimonas sp. CC4]CAA6687100.1 Signal recognition particle receptor protein FtsY (=alpha subunit) (TC 3.A.5.1.1) [Lentimonas sp. CC6]CAA6691489.1 Signal recognition particle receptor protein FtsY (=alpha subunit) (TC 3.A.5.1.1) [Lentimonas sp. CC10]CAA6696154.1 Signal recognition particle receptor protein FtsY
MRSLFKKFKEGLKRQTPTFHKAFDQVFTGAKLDQDALDQLEEALYTADFGVETVEEIIEEIQAAYKADKEIRGEDAAKIGATVLTRVLEGAEGTITVGQHKPEVIALIGVNGSGKTTTTAKLGHLYQNEGYSLLIGACDTFRAAANEQIKHWAEKLNIDIVSSHHGADSAAVAFDAYEAAKNRGRDIVILDTAGRLHTKSNLMKELEKLKRVVEKQDPEAPHHSWLVVDGSLGSNSIEQARVFNESFPLTGLIITKLDGTSRGGALVGIYRELKLPIYFVGLGEQPDDLQPFSAKNYANAIFGITEEDS